MSETITMLKGNGITTFSLSECDEENKTFHKNEEKSFHIDVWTSSFQNLYPILCERVKMSELLSECSNLHGPA